MPYASVTICKPGTSACTTINNVLVDTGSQGLRLLASAVPTGFLTPEQDSKGNTYAECGQFASGVTWGPVVSADIKLAGEVAASQGVQLIGGGSAAVPADCASLGNAMDSTTSLYANGILGVGSFPYDCGDTCVSQAVSATYYTCSGSACSNATIPLTLQVQNPVFNFPQDNNGVALSLEAVPAGGSPSATGTLTFGIGTQSNNVLAAKNVITADPTYAEFTTSYNGTSFPSFLDSGSNYFFFVDNSILQCQSGNLVSSGFYCPASTLSLSATAISSNGQTSATIPFAVGNASSLFASGSYAAFDDVAANAGFLTTPTFDWGLPFFYGKTVYVGIEDRSATGAGAGPFYAW
jgi:hypothetical protein